ncbi:MAG: hypothetical protein LBC20_15840 [Planctomycetaceae bacterium]|nr:hypothetical protein [Planctomycetaceae bacterium]
MSLSCNISAEFLFFDFQPDREVMMHNHGYAHCITEGLGNDPAQNQFIAV